MRVAGTVEVDLDESSIIDFFDRRARAASDARTPGVTMLQDGNARIALQRSDVEVQTLVKLLDWLPVARPRTLDVGCGSGRLYFALRERLGAYVGVDGSPSLVEAAGRTVALRPTAAPARFAVQDLSRPGLAGHWPRHQAAPQLVLMSGILIYLNDASTRRLLAELAAMLRGPALIVMREPVGIETRLSLKDHWSDELKASYNAIYRTRDELRELVAEAFGRCLQRFEARWLYDAPELNNRAETRQALMTVGVA